MEREKIFHDEAITSFLLLCEINPHGMLDEE